MRRRVLLTLIGLAGCLVSRPAAGELLIRQTWHTDPYEQMGQIQPAKDQDVEIWLGKGRAAISGADFDLIIRLDEQRAYILDRPGRSYAVVPLPLDLASMLGADDPDAEMLVQMLDMMKSSAQVTPTATTKRFGPWTARLYRVSITSDILGIRMETWASTEFAVDATAYSSLQGALLALNPATKDAAAELEKIEGVVVYEEQTIEALGTEMKIRRETVAVEQKPAPAGTFSPPSGYHERPFDPAAALGRG